MRSIDGARLVVALGILCFAGAAWAEEPAATIPIADLKFESVGVMSGEPALSEHSILLMWELGKGVRDLKGGSFVLLAGPTAQYLGWSDEQSQIQAALDACFVPYRFRLSSTKCGGAVVYQRQGVALERMPGVVEMVETTFAHEGKEHEASYPAFACDGCTVHTRKLLWLLGVAVKSKESRVRLYVGHGDYAWEALVGADGKVREVLGMGWSTKVPPEEAPDAKPAAPKP